jgi:membrane protease YdiL (CAAX protease family)
MSDSVGAFEVPEGSAPSSRVRKILFGPHGLRAGWSLVIFVAVSTLLTGAGAWIFLKFHPLPDNPPWTAGLIIAFELVSLVATLAAMLVLGKVEGRSLATYGFPFAQAFGRRFWEGSLWGILSIGTVIASMTAVGAYRIQGWNVQGGEAVTSMLLWALALLLVGVYEELFFRGAPLFTLSRGLGFWPAALLLSLYFAGVHYFQKPMETWVDALSVGLIGLWFCGSVRRTGDIWLAIGWHFAYNFGSIAVLGGPNTGNQGKPVAGHLLDSSFHGSQWITGGPMGPEASLFIFPVIAAMFIALWLRYPKAAWYPDLGLDTERSEL